MNNVINQLSRFKSTRILAVLFAVLLLPQGMWAQTLTKTYNFTSSTPKVINEEGITRGGYLECNGVTTWELSEDGDINNDREILLGYSQSSPELWSYDNFYKVNKVTVNVSMQDCEPDQPYVQLECNGQSAEAHGVGSHDIVFNFTAQTYYPNGPLTIEVYFAFPSSFTLNSIAVEYERANFNLAFRREGVDASYVYIDWSDRYQPNLPWLEAVSLEQGEVSLYDLGQSITYTSSNRSVATINESGYVTIVSPGTTTIEAEFAGNTQYTASSAQYVLTVEDDRDEPSLSFSSATAEVTYGSESEFEAPTLLNEDNLFPITYSSSNKKVATISSNGTVTLVAPGQTTIRARFGGDDYYQSTSASYLLTYYAKTLTDDMITVTPANAEYNGSPQVPTVTVKDGTTTLAVGTDYTLTNKGGTDVGTYPVVVEGTGNYTGTVTADFTIAKAKAKVTTPPAAKNLTYTGAAQELITAGQASGGTMQYSLDGGAFGTAIPKGTEAKTYTVKYKVVGDANHSDTEDATVSGVQIKAASATITVSIAGWTYGEAANAPTVTGNTGNGTVTYEYKVKSAADDTYTKTVPTNAGTYTVRATVAATANYGGATATADFTIAKAKSAVSFEKKSYEVELGDAFNAPRASTKPEGLAVSYTSGNTAVATVNSQTGEVTPLAEGEATITATFAGNNNYEGASASYTLTVKESYEKYGLWIGDVQVTGKNCTDVFNDGSPEAMIAGSYQYVPSCNTLFITNAREGKKIEVNLPDGLTIYLAPQSLNMVSSIVYLGYEEVPLTITTDGNYPGILMLNGNEKVISGFASLTLEEGLAITSPEDVSYQDYRLDALMATIASPLLTITNPKSVMADSRDLNPESWQKDVNKVVNDALYTLGDVDNPEGDGFDDTLGCIVLNSTMTDAEVEAASKLIPGSEEFLKTFKGITLKVAAGSGSVDIDASSIEGYSVWAKVGEAVPQFVGNGSQKTMTFRYAVADPTYIYIYGKDDAAKARAVSKGGKKTVVHIKIHDVKVNPTKVNAANPVGEASDGEYLGDTSHLLGQTVVGYLADFPIPGDANGDGIVNAADIVELVNTIMGRQSGTFDKKAADVNNDATVNAADIVEIVKLIMGG